jgi:hypothetical protein
MIVSRRSAQKPVADQHVRVSQFGPAGAFARERQSSINIVVGLGDAFPRDLFGRALSADLPAGCSWIRYVTH